MHVDRRLVAFGLFLIAVGGVMVAVRQGVVPATVAHQAWTLWPLILVGTGWSIVLAGRPGAVLGGLVVALTSGVILGGIAAGGAFPGVGFCAGNRESGAAFADRGGNLVDNARVTIAQNCGNLEVGTVAGSTWSLTGRSRDGQSPQIDESPERVRISTPDRGPLDLGGAGGWTVVLPRDVTLDASIEVNGGTSRLAFNGAILSRLSVDLNAGSTDVDLSGVAGIGDLALDVNLGSAIVRLPARTLSASLSVNAGSASICRPAGSAIRIKLASVAGSNDFASHGLIQANGGWETPGYAEASNRLDIRGEVNAGGVSLDPVGACG